jgi:hypothetical protein
VKCKYRRPARSPEPRRDIDAVAKEVAVAFDDVADRDADAEAHLPARRISEVSRAQAFLDVDGATHRLHRARELGKHGIAGGVENPAARARDEIVHHRPIRSEAPQRLFFVLGNEPAVACDIGSKNSRDFSFHVMRSAASRRNYSMPLPTAPRDRCSLVRPLVRRAKRRLQRL